MRPMVRVLATIVALTAIASPAFAQKQVQLLTMVSDPNGGEVTTLEPKDVHVFENGQPVTVTMVEPVQRVAKLQILIDEGSGMPSESIGDLRKAVGGLIAAIPPGVETTLVTTAPQPRFLEKATTDHDKLVQAVTRLAPDQGVGHFVDSLLEAVERIDKDSNKDAAYTIVTVGTTSGDGDARQADVNKIVDRVRARQTVIYAVVYNKIGTSASSGSIQLDLAQSLGPGTGGRSEIINIPNRLVTLLPEIGTQMAKTLGPGARQFRITVDRSSAGALGPMSLSVEGKAASNVRIERK